MSGSSFIQEFEAIEETVVQWDSSWWQGVGGYYFAPRHLFNRETYKSNQICNSLLWRPFATSVGDSTHYPVYDFTKDFTIPQLFVKQGDYGVFTKFETNLWDMVQSNVMTFDSSNNNFKPAKTEPTLSSVMIDTIGSYSNTLMQDYWPDFSEQQRCYLETAAPSSMPGKDMASWAQGQPVSWLFRNSPRFMNECYSMYLEQNRKEDLDMHRSGDHIMCFGPTASVYKSGQNVGFAIRKDLSFVQNNKIWHERHDLSKVQEAQKKCFDIFKKLESPAARCSQYMSTSPFQWVMPLSFLDGTIPSNNFQTFLSKYDNGRLHKWFLSFSLNGKRNMNFRVKWCLVDKLCGIPYWTGGMIYAGESLFYTANGDHGSNIVQYQSGFVPGMLNLTYLDRCGKTLDEFFNTIPEDYQGEFELDQAFSIGDRSIDHLVRNRVLPFKHPSVKLSDPGGIVDPKLVSQGFLVFYVIPESYTYQDNGLTLSRTFSGNYDCGEINFKPTIQFRNANPHIYDEVFGQDIFTTKQQEDKKKGQVVSDMSKSTDIQGVQEGDFRSVKPVLPNSLGHLKSFVQTILEQRQVQDPMQGPLLDALLSSTTSQNYIAQVGATFEVRNTAWNKVIPNQSAYPTMSVFSSALLPVNTGQDTESGEYNCQANNNVPHYILGTTTTAKSSIDLLDGGDKNLFGCQMYPLPAAQQLQGQPNYKKSCMKDILLGAILHKILYLLNPAVDTSMFQAWQLGQIQYFYHIHKALSGIHNAPDLESLLCGFRDDPACSPALQAIIILVLLLQIVSSSKSDVTMVEKEVIIKHTHMTDILDYFSSVKYVPEQEFSNFLLNQGQDRLQSVLKLNNVPVSIDFASIYSLNKSSLISLVKVLLSLGLLSGQDIHNAIAKATSPVTGWFKRLIATLTKVVKHLISWFKVGLNIAESVVPVLAILQPTGILRAAQTRIDTAIQVVEAKASVPGEFYRVKMDLNLLWHNNSNLNDAYRLEAPTMKDFLHDYLDIFVFSNEFDVKSSGVAMNDVYDVTPYNPNSMIPERQWVRLTENTELSQFLLHLDLKTDSVSSVIGTHEFTFPTSATSNNSFMFRRTIIYNHIGASQVSGTWDQSSRASITVQPSGSWEYVVPK